MSSPKKKSYVDSTLFTRASNSSDKDSVVVISSKDIKRIKSPSSPSSPPRKPSSSPPSASPKPSPASSPQLDSKNVKSPSNRPKSHTSLDAVEKRFQEKEEQKRQALESDLKEFAKKEMDRKAAERQASLSKAKEKVFFEDDKVKALHSTLFTAQVLAERQAQLVEKVEKDETAKKQEEEWKKVLYTAVESDKQKEERKKEMEREKQREMAAIRSSQLAESREREHERQEAEAEAARRVQADYELHRERLSKEERERHERQHQMQQQILDENKKLKGLHEAERLREIEEDEKALHAREENDRIQAERKREEKKKFDARQKVRQNLIDKEMDRMAAETTFSGLSIDEDKLLKNMKAMDAKKEEELKQQAEEQRRKNKEIAQFREEQAMRKRKIVTEGQKQDKEYVENWKGLVDKDVQKQKQKELEAHDKRVQTKEFLKSQMTDKQRKEIEAKYKEKAEAEAFRQAMVDHDADFNKYADQCIDDLNIEAHRSEAVRKIVSKKINPVPVTVSPPQTLSTSLFAPPSPDDVQPVHRTRSPSKLRVEMPSLASTHMALGFDPNAKPGITASPKKTGKKFVSRAPKSNKA